MKKTLKQKHLEFLQSKGWVVDTSTRVSKYVVLSKHGMAYHYYLGGAGAVRRGRTVGESYSVKLKLDEPVKAAKTDVTEKAEALPEKVDAMDLMAEAGKPEADPTPAPAMIPASSRVVAAAPTAESNGSSACSANGDVACVVVPVGHGKTTQAVSTPLASILRQSIAAVEKDRRPPTPEQQAIIDAAEGLGKGDVLVIAAGAGTGKTTTLTMLERALKGVGQYTAFNSSLVKESSRKFSRVACSTTHSLAFRAVGKDFAHRLEGGRVKSSEIARILGVEDLKLPWTDAEGKPATKTLVGGWLMGQVLSAIKRFCQSADRELTSDHFRYIDGIDLPCDGQRTYTNNALVREYLLPFAQAAWADLSSPQGTLPFSHDHYVKVWQLSKPVIAADFILLDEAQDTAPVMLDVLRQQKALIVLVGDDAQQIYEWRGAVNAMTEDQWPDSTRLYLSQSFRFGPAIAAVANQILEKVGTELRLKGLPSIPSEVRACSDPTAILCRTNAVAVATLLRAISEGKRPFLVGGGAEVIAFVEGAKALQEGRSTSHPELACFSSWGEVEEYSKLDEGEDLKLMVKLIAAFGCDAILSALRGMPTEANADLIICTAHKSKGREWERVKLASDFPTLSKCSDADFKLLYVAATRAKLVLDVSECPFFTGEDAMPVIPTAPRQVEGILPPTPAAKPVASEFSWSKGKDGGWNIRGPHGHAGKTVKVVSRDGRTSTVRLGAVKAEYDEATVYAKG